MTDKFILALELGGKSFFIERGGGFRLLSASGLEAAEYELAFEGGGTSDGGYVVGARFGPRKIVLELEPAGDAEASRAELVSALSPKNSGTLTVTRGNVTRKIAFVPCSAEFIQPNIFTPAKIRLTLLCPDPFFTDPDETVVSFRKTAPLLTFPFNSFAGCGIASGIWRISDTATIKNSGDADIGIVCTIRATGGTVVNPSVELEGVGFVKLYTVLEDGGELKVNTRRGEKSVNINGEKRFIFDRRSVFFQLPPGENKITVSADAGLSYANASFSYILRYNGI
jgi:hypothetical protein